MKWKTIVMTSAGTSLGVGGTYTWFSGFNPVFLLVAAAVSLLAAILLGYVETLGKRK
jgi:hypothetical protein